MNFTDLSFLFGFLPIVWLIYRYLIKKTSWSNLYLLIVSLIFYAWGSLTSLLVLLVVLGWNFCSARVIDQAVDAKQKKLQLIFSIVVDLLILAFYRYLPMLGSLDSMLPTRFSALASMMPVGLSFYLFSCMSCLFDVYRDKAPAPDSLVDFGVYAAFFGRVNMGPIAHWAKFREQLTDHPQNRQKNTKGMQLFLQGLFRKVILADNFALIFTALAGNTSWLGTVLYMFAYFFELYFDFSGYSRMARGIGYLFGFEIPANFNLPYTALSNQDFWRRWHISLTDWFRDNVYIPLGGNRVSRRRWMLNVMCVWLLTGIWHGANGTFILWGLYQGLLILMENTLLNGKLDGIPNPIRHTYVVISQLIGWTFFAAASVPAAFSVLGRLFGIGVTQFAGAESWFVLKQSIVLLMIAVILASGFSEWLTRLVRRMCGTYAPIFQAVGGLTELIICTAFLVSASAQTFLYAVF